MLRKYHYGCQVAPKLVPTTLRIIGLFACAWLSCAQTIGPQLVIAPLDPQLVISVLDAGQSDAERNRRDLAAIFALLRESNAREYQALRSAVALNVGLQPNKAAMLFGADEDSLKADHRGVGPIAATSAGASETFRLLAAAANHLHKPDLFVRAVRETARISGLTPSAIRFAAKTQELLGSNDPYGGLWWRDEFAPAILQEKRDDPALIAAAHGGILPADWQVVALWFRPWLDTRQLDPPDNDGYFKALTTGYKPSASHPLSLALVRDRLLSSLTDEATREHFKWLAGQARADPVALFGPGLFVLEAATRRGVSLNSAGAVSATDSFWSDLTTQVLARPVIAADSGTQFAAWKGTSELLNRLYTATERARHPVVGARDFGDALLLFGQQHMREVWSAFNKAASARAAKLFSFKPDESLRRDAKADRQRLASTFANPLCAPWLTRSMAADPPGSLEATATAAAYLHDERSPGLARGIIRVLEPALLAMNSAARSDAKEAFRIAESLDPWLPLRGHWLTVKARSAGAVNLPASPWAPIDQSDLLAYYQGLVSVWTTPTAEPDAATRGALSVLAWLGTPATAVTTQLAHALHAAANRTGIQPEQKIFFQAARLSLAVSSAMAGSDLETAFGDTPLLGASEIEQLPALVAELYQSGLPLGIRTSVDTAWLLAKQASYLEDTSDEDFDAATVAELPSGARNTHLRDVARRVVSALDSYVSTGMDRLRTQSKQSGAALGLAEFQLSLSVGLADTAQPFISVRRRLLEQTAATGITASTAGTGYLGLEAWAEHWERQMRRLNRMRLLTVGPIPFDSPQLASSLCVYLSSTAAILSPADGPLPASAWLEPGSWVKGRKTNVAADPGASVMVLPWTRSAETGATLIDLLSRAAIDKAQAADFSTVFDIDNLNARYWPPTTWAAAMSDLERDSKQIRDIEQSLAHEYGKTDLKATIASLKPLLAAPLVTSLAGFEHELQAAVADMRRAESKLRSAHEQSVAALLEIKAQQILTQVYALEKQRTDALLEINDNKVKIAKLDGEIAAAKKRKAELEKDKANTAVAIASIDKQIADLGQQQKTIQIRTVARAVAVLQNQLKLLQDLIYAPIQNPKPGDGPPRFSGQLGYIAYDASKQVTAKLAEINAQKSAMERQLSDLQESSFFKAIGRFVGAVVGFVIAGPAGVQLGAMIGDAVGGIVSQIKQGQPLSNVFSSFIQSGVRIATAAGFDGSTLQSGLGIEKGELAGIIAKGEQMLGALTKDLPAFIDAVTLESAMVINTADAGVRNLVDSVRTGLVKNLRQSVPRDSLDPLIAALPNVVLSGSPARVKADLQTAIENQLQSIPVTADLKSAARAVGVALSSDLGDPELRRQVADKLSTVAVINAVPALDGIRLDVLQKLMISLTTVQEALRAGNFSSVGELLNGASISGTLGNEYSAQVDWLRSKLAQLPSQAGREIPWTDLEPAVRSAVTALFPADPERLEFAVAQFQRHLDRTGAQAEIQAVLNPWNSALQVKMTAVQRTLDRPCGGDEEDRLKCAIAQLNEAGQQTQAMLTWLQDGNSTEYVELRKKVDDKQKELHAAQDNLDLAKLDLEKARQAVVRAGFVEKNATIDVMLAEFSDKVATLARQQSVLAISNAELQLRRTRLQQEQDTLNQLASGTRAQALEARYHAALADGEAARADLGRAASLVMAAQDRATIQRQVRAWYVSAGSESMGPPSRVQSLVDDRTYHIERAARSVRNLLRLLRVAGIESSGFSPPSSATTWGQAFARIEADLRNRFSRVGGFSVQPPLVIDLTSAQIGQLFSGEGLTLYIQHMPAPLIPPRRSRLTDNVWPIAPQRIYQRVFMAFLMAEDAPGQPSDQSRWNPDSVEHGPVAPYLVREGAAWTGNYLLASASMRLRLDSWQDPIPEVQSQDQILKHVISRLGVADWAGAADKATFQTRPGIPLTGAYHLHIDGVAPQRARLILVYTQPD